MCVRNFTPQENICLIGEKKSHNQQSVFAIAPCSVVLFGEGLEEVGIAGTLFTPQGGVQGWQWLNESGPACWLKAIGPPPAGLVVAEPRLHSRAMNHEQMASHQQSKDNTRSSKKQIDVLQLLP